MPDELEAIARTEIQKGWEVFDADGEKVGKVEDVGSTSFLMRGIGPVPATVEIGFAEVESADDGQVDLLLTQDEIALTQSDLGA